MLPMYHPRQRFARPISAGLGPPELAKFRPACRAVRVEGIGVSPCFAASWAWTDEGYFRVLEFSVAEF